MIKIQISYVAQIEVIMLSYKEKARMHDRGRIIWIITKLGTNVDFIKIQIEFVELLSRTNRNDKENTKSSLEVAILIRLYPNLVKKWI